jgi:hydrogenase expression/formation protein HypE
MPKIEASLPAQLERMERARRHAAHQPRVTDQHVTLSHGSGGKAMHALIASVVVPSVNPSLDTSVDAATVSLNGQGRIVMTTDSYVVSPLFFPGGDIGRLAVHGTINDVATSGAKPIAMSLGLILEEGLSMDILRRVLDSIGEASREAGVPVVTGDTKVVPRGKADQLFINTTGVGLLDGDTPALSPRNVQPGDRVIISGFVADHGVAIMLAREALEIDSAIESDSAALHHMIADVLRAAPGTRVIKDPTRGGVATTLNEIARAAGVSVALDETKVPLRPSVRGACEILGLDPFQIANEGKVIAIVPPDEVDAALDAFRRSSRGVDASVCGEVMAEPEGLVFVRTSIGGSRVLDMLVGDPLPRIC